MKKLIVFAALVFVCFAGRVNAQSVVCTAPCAATVDASGHISLLSGVQSGQIDLNKYAAEARPTLDKKLVLSIAAIWAIDAADIENTQYVFRKDAGGRELNPIFGTGRPSRARMWEVSAPGQVLATYLTWHWKRQDALIDAAIANGVPVKRHIIRWYWVPTLAIGEHGVAIGITIGNTGR